MKERIAPLSWTVERQRDFRSRLAPVCDYTHARAVVVEGATVRPLSHGARRHDHLRTTARHRRHRLLLLAAVHPCCLRATLLRRSHDRHMGLPQRGRCARWYRRRPRGGRRIFWHCPARARLRAMGVASPADHPALCRTRHCRRLQRHARNRPDGDAFTHLADDLRRHRRDRRQHHGSSASPEWPRPDQPDRAWRGADTHFDRAGCWIRHSVCPPSSASNTE
jgi:hypothetical protein